MASGTTPAVPAAGIEAKVTSYWPASAFRWRPRVVAIWEAVTNATAHDRTPAPAVDIRLSPTGDEVIATITDHGPCFAPGAVPDRLAPQRLRPGGRGLFLIHCCTDIGDYTSPSCRRVSSGSRIDRSGGSRTCAGADAGGGVVDQNGALGGPAAGSGVAAWLGESKALSAATGGAWVLAGVRRLPAIEGLVGPTSDQPFATPAIRGASFCRESSPGRPRVGGQPRERARTTNTTLAQPPPP
ncbi:ATP-binding protein [Spirillospora sp. CA-255316]